MENHKILILLLSLLLLWGCTAEEEIWSHSYNIENQQWLHDQVLTTSWTPSTDIPESQLLIEVTHTSDFRYQNLYMKKVIDIEERDFQQTDTFSIQLATRNSGRWLSERITENERVKTDTLMVLPPISKGETIHLSLEQFGRDSLIRDLSQIRWRLISAE